MRRNVSLKGLIILGILIIAAAYYFVFHLPVSNQMESLEAQQADLDTKLVTAQAQVSDMHRMEKALDDLEASGAQAVEMPQYNNIDRMLLELNTIMAGTNNYSITFSDASASENIARRALNVSFSVPNYDAVVSKIKAINKSENRYLITDMSLRRGINNAIIMGNSDGFVSANLTLTSFEYVSPNGEQPPKSEAEKQKEKEAALAIIQEEQ